MFLINFGLVVLVGSFVFKFWNYSRRSLVSFLDAYDDSSDVPIFGLVQVCLLILLGVVVVALS